MTDLSFSSAIKCDALEDASSNQSIVYSDTTNNPYALGSTATYVCDEGFYLTENLHRTCEATNENGTWTPSDTAAPICEGKSPAADFLNGINMFSV